MPTTVSGLVRVRVHSRWDIPADTLHNNDVVITPKRRHFDVITSKWRRFDVKTTLLLRHVFGGITPMALEIAGIPTFGASPQCITTCTDSTTPVGIRPLYVGQPIEQVVMGQSTKRAEIWNTYLTTWAIYKNCNNDEKLHKLFILTHLPPSAAYMCLWNGSALVIQIMACRLNGRPAHGAKPLSEPVLTYCQLDPKEHISMKFYLKFKYFHSRKCVSSTKWRPFCPGEMS